MDELLNRVQQYEGPPYVVVLDETDQLEEEGVLYDLHQVRNLSMVLISNKEETLFTQLDDRLVSRLHAARRIPLERYQLDELADILQQRAQAGLEKDAIDRPEIELISDLAAGDARIGIAILRSAAREAERRGTAEITDDLIESVAPDARDTVQQKALDQLKEHQRILYRILEEDGEMEPGELYGRYEAQVDEPKTNRTVRNYLQKMEHYNLIVAEGENRARTYRVR
jgi:Cdc6-like AAA superfamily ATPase